jgi:hypothetical protein
VSDPTWEVVWDNGHASGSLGTYPSEEAAEAAAESWRLEMIAMDDDPAEAEEAYSYDIYGPEDT